MQRAPAGLSFDVTHELLDRSLPSRAYRAMDEMHKSRTTYSSLHRYDISYSRKYYRLLKELTALKQKRESLIQK